LTTGLPLLVVAGPLAAMLGMDPEAQPVLLAGLLPGTLDLSLLGTAGAAVVLGARRGIIDLPVIPLTVPVLIFGAAAPSAATMGLSARPSLLLLCAILL